MKTTFKFFISLSVSLALYYFMQFGLSTTAEYMLGIYNSTGFSLLQSLYMGIKFFAVQYQQFEYQQQTSSAIAILIGAVCFWRLQRRRQPRRIFS